MPRFLRRRCQSSQQPLHAQPTHSEEEETPAAPGCGGKVISIDYRSIIENHRSRSSSPKSDFSQLSPLYLALLPWNLSSRSIVQRRITNKGVHTHHTLTRPSIRAQKAQNSTPRPKTDHLLSSTFSFPFLRWPQKIPLLEISNTGLA